MLRKSVLFLSALAIISGSSFAQTQQRHCYTDEVRAQKIKENPEILQKEKDLEQQLKDNLKKIDINKLAKTTVGDTTWYDIPCVVHIIHDYGVEDLTDAQVIASIADWNIIYSASNSDTSAVIAPFKKYIGNPRIRVHLATKDPFGNPTHGITRRRSYLTTNGGENAKFDDWSPNSYLNVWSVNKFGQAHADAEAYAIYPATAAAEPYYDGAITIYEALGFDPALGRVLNHEMSHLLNLKHTFGDANQAGTSSPCGDDDVDDTPPTHGDQPGFGPGCPIYTDTQCAQGYLKLYPSSVPGIDSLVDYPDTCNVQNIMNYSTCNLMFTKGQVQRMHDCMNNSIAGRSNLVDSANLVLTGALAAWPDLTPIPDFSVDYSYTTIGSGVTFTNFTWNDTVTKVKWTFNSTTDSIVKSAVAPTYFTTPNLAFGTVSFKSKGWVTVTQTATGTGTSGVGVLVDSSRVFIADTAATQGVGYFQEFSPGSDRDMWPTFNYYNNEFKWQYANVGYFDNTSLMYTGFDSRISNFGRPVTGVPKGDSDDVFSPFFDLTGLQNGPATPSLNFMYSGATRSGNSLDMNDSLKIYYIVGYPSIFNTWQLLTVMKTSEMANTGSNSTYFTPGGGNDWSLKSIPLPAGTYANGKKVAFRFTYRPGVNELGYTKTEGYSTGNNFYIDRINFSNYPAGVNTLLPKGGLGVVVAPNPTTADAYVVIKDADDVDAKIQVSDMSGRIVYSTHQRTAGQATTVLIPKSVISVSGMYIINVSTPNQIKTEKLVVY